MAVQFKPSNKASLTFLVIIMGFPHLGIPGDLNPSPMVSNASQTPECLKVPVVFQGEATPTY